MRLLAKSSVGLFGIFALTATAARATDQLNGSSVVTSLTGDPGNLHLQGDTLSIEGGYYAPGYDDFFLRYDYENTYDRTVTMSTEGGAALWRWGSHHLPSGEVSPQMELGPDSSFRIGSTLDLDSKHVLTLSTTEPYYYPDTIKLDPGSEYSSPPFTPSIKIGPNRVLTTADFPSLGFLAAMPNNAMVLSGTSGTGTVPTTGAGTRLMWYPGKAAFRVGQVTSIQWDEIRVGTASTAMGYNTIAQGAYSTALGNTTTASGASSFAAGQSSSATGANSVVLGMSSSASGQYAVSLGRSSTASGISSVALGGFQSVASGPGSISIGMSTQATALGSIALGYGNIGGGNSSAWNEGDTLFELGNAEMNPSSPVAPTTRSNAITTLKNGQTTLKNKTWQSGQPLSDPDPLVSTDSDGNALVVDGHTVLNGKVIISQPQGGVSMGIYE